MNAYLGVECSRITNISLQRLRTELRMNGVILEPMHVDDVFRDIQIRLLVAFIQYHEEQVETTHDGGSHGDVRTEGLLAVVATSDGIGCSKNGCACI